MDVEIIEKRQNPLLNRQEIRFKILHPKEPTPNRDSAREKIASLSSVKKEQVIIDSLESTFGKSETFGYAKVYPSKEEAMKNERDYHLVRNRLKEGKKKASKQSTIPTLETGPAPAPGTAKASPAAEGKEEETPKEETPTEEKKDEAPAKEEGTAADPKAQPASEAETSKKKEG